MQSHTERITHFADIYSFPALDYQTHQSNQNTILLQILKIILCPMAGSQVIRILCLRLDYGPYFILLFELKII
jgi:hypothetical protein